MTSTTLEGMSGVSSIRAARLGERLPKSRQKDEAAMRKADFTNVDEYISAQPETAQVVLQRVRSTLRKALPGAEEVISYRIPAYRLHGGIVLYFAGWKQHYSLYPAGERLVAALRDQLASYKVSKGTIRFPLCEPIPVKLIERIAKLRAEEGAQREKSKRASSKRGFNASARARTDAKRITA
jgi:uncharacterized protein YdhG (YjbR/CyaY superfamily)